MNVFLLLDPVGLSHIIACWLIHSAGVTYSAEQ